MSSWPHITSVGVVTFSTSKKGELTASQRSRSFQGSPSSTSQSHW